MCGGGFFDFELLKEAFLLIKNKEHRVPGDMMYPVARVRPGPEHLNIEGLKNCVALKAPSNLGALPEGEIKKKAFPNLVLVARDH